MLRIVFAFLMVSALSISAFAGKIESGEDLIKAMHAKYKGKWYKTLTFVQKNTRHMPNGEKQYTVWYEAMKLPGKLRVDMDGLNKNGMMFADGKQMMFQNGKMARSADRLHPLMVLGFDVYGQPAETTLAQVKKLGFDLNTIHMNKWQGRDVYVVGAKKGDEKTKQFWVDKERLLFVRSMQPGGRDGTSVSETQFNKYERVKSGGWISPYVVFLTDGKVNFEEVYTQMKTNVSLDDALFDPNQWSTADLSMFKVKKK